MEKQPDRPSHSAHVVDYKEQYEELFAACGKANGERKILLTTVSGHIKALLTVICEPDPPGCSGPIPFDDPIALLKECQSKNADKKKQLQTIDHEVDALMMKMCEPDPPGCT